MTARWTAADFRRDASDLTAEATDAALGELYAGRDDWDEAPTSADIARDEEWADRHAYDDWGSDR